MEKPANKRRGIYNLSILNRNVVLPFKSLGNNISELISESLINEYEGKCVKEGYIKTNSIRIINFTCGKLKETDAIFSVNFECLLCNPVEGMNMKVVVKNVTKAGLRCEIKGSVSPVIAFVARDHHNRNKNFSTIKVDDEIIIKVVGIRYELNDEYISVIGELFINKMKKAPKLIIKNKKT
jgi:DNA-directed RNA polymerase subunit E'/Rpb7